MALISRQAAIVTCGRWGYSKVHQEKIAMLEEPLAPAGLGGRSRIGGAARAAHKIKVNGGRWFPELCRAVRAASNCLIALVFKLMYISAKHSP